MPALVKRRIVKPKAWEWWALLVSIYGTIVGVLLAVEKQIKPSTAKWLHEPWLLGSLAVALSLVTGFEAARRGRLIGGKPAYDRNRVEIRNHLATAVVSVADAHNISASELGCGLFLIEAGSRRRPGWAWDGPRKNPFVWKSPKRPERLQRVERVRMPDDLHESPVKFNSGKGAVGMAWQAQREQHNDWIGINKKYLASMSDAQWTRVPDKVKRGFEKDEFISLLGKYAEVLAVPITINGAIVGCVAIDRKWDEDAPATACLLDQQVSKTLASTAARVVCPLLG